MLLDRGCPLDVADSRAGDTVLHLATRAGDNALLAVLLRKGANPDIANKVQFAYLFSTKQFRSDQWVFLLDNNHEAISLLNLPICSLFAR